MPSNRERRATEVCVSRLAWPHRIQGTRDGRSGSQSMNVISEKLVRVNSYCNLVAWSVLCMCMYVRFKACLTY